MRMRMVHVEVTAADIESGSGRSVTDNHPIAIAIRRALGMGSRVPPYVGVGENWFSIKVHGSFYESHDLPDGTGVWIMACQLGEPVEPFCFTFRTGWGA